MGERVTHMSKLMAVPSRAAWALALLAASFVPAQPAAADGAAPGLHDVRAAFNLTGGELVGLNLPEQPEDFDLGLPFGEASLMVRLHPHSVRAPGYRLIKHLGGDVYEDVPPAPERTLRGEIVDDPGSVIAASLIDGGLVARLFTSAGEEYWVEPITSRFPGADADLHVMYRREDVATPVEGQCHLERDSFSGLGEELPIGLRGTEPACVTGTCLSELAIDTDFEFVSRYGTPGTQDRINAIVNTINIQYERDVDIRMQISAIILRTTDAPYTTFSAGTLLSQFKTQWQSFHQNIPRDVAHLLAGRDLASPFIGGAHDSSVCSNIFTGLGYSVVESDYPLHLASFNFMPSWIHTTDVTAHELGHNWGADHCACNGGTPATSYTMNDGITGANRFHPAFTIPEIGTFRDSVTCLQPLLGDQSGTTTLPLIETFPTTTISATKWTAILGPEVSLFGNNEPSLPYSLNLAGNSVSGDALTSAIIDTSGLDIGTLVLEYYWQKQGGGDAPEPGNNLFVEYFDSLGEWTIIDAQFANVPSSTTQFTHMYIDYFPETAYHTGFRLRFRMRESFEIDQDDWFIDDIHLHAVALATCDDGILNQDEERIDCGGSCDPCECTSDGACSNGNACDGVETCNAHGGCVVGTPLTCDDMDACTADSCDPGSGCVFQNTCEGACCTPQGCALVASEEACTPFVCDVAQHLPGSFTGCYGDADGNGFVNAADRGFISAAVGQSDAVSVCRYDLDGNGVINAGDRGFVSAYIGLCETLPDWMDGSGTRNGLPDTRFGTASFLGGGTTCDACD